MAETIQVSEILFTQINGDTPRADFHGKSDVLMEDKMGYPNFRNYIVYYVTHNLHCFLGHNTSTIAARSL